MHRIVFVLLLLAPLASAAPVPKGVKAKAPNLDGRWEAVEFHVGKQDVLRGNPWVWDIAGEELTILNRQPDGSVRANDPNTTTTLTRVSGQADAIDYHRKDRTGRDSRLPALFVIADDMLTLSYADEGKERPTDLGRGSRVTVIVFKRVEK